MDTTTPASQQDLKEEVQHFRDQWKAIQSEVGKVMVGQERVVEATISALLCGGNVLLEGVPGLGKTELIKSLARVLDLEFRRIQFTPDLMPADVIGTNIMTTDDNGRYRLEFRPGPVFTQLLLADEINRASPKTQSALLETMQERTVTTGGTIHTMKEPYFVMATQNPIEQEGTYPLPEAQLDRFLFKINVPFLSRGDMHEVVRRTILRVPQDLSRVVDAEGILRMRKILDKVVVADPMVDYAVRLVLATHPHEDKSHERVRRFVRWGASPRAAQALIRAARVRALGAGRTHVAFEDIRHFAPEVLRHRVLLNYDGQAENVNISELIDECVRQLPEAG
jgi:MoxR-like ATPase